MSADNYIGIWKSKKGKFYGYDLSASMDAPKRRPQYAPRFVVNNLKKAIKKAQSEYTEYGYTFMNI